MFETIGRAFDDTVLRYPAHDALIVPHQNLRLTYAQLKGRVDALAAGLLSLGLSPGERLGIWAPNCAEWTITQFAAAKIGLILVNINPAYRLSELEYCLNKVACRALVTAERLKSSDYLSMLLQLAPELSASVPNDLKSVRLPHLKCVIRIGAGSTPGCIGFNDLLKERRRG